VRERHQTHVRQLPCVKCHGTRRPEAKLHLDPLEGALKGDADGKVVRPGKSAESPLVHYFAQVGDEDNWMPPKGNKANRPPLTSEEVELVRA